MDIMNLPPFQPLVYFGIFSILSILSLSIYTWLIRRGPIKQLKFARNAYANNLQNMTKADIRNTNELLKQDNLKIDWVNNNYKIISTTFMDFDWKYHIRINLYIQGMMLVFTEIAYGLIFYF
jgi:hypothetical protein